MVHLMDRNERSRIFVSPLRLAVAGIFMGMAVSGISRAQEGRSRFLLSTAQIESAIEGRQMPTRGIRLRLATPITSSVPDPLLEIQDISPVNSNEIRLRITCHDRSECLPFFAFATYPEAVDIGGFQTKRNLLKVAADRSTPGTKPLAVPITALPADVGGRGEPVVRSGSPATLDFDEERVHVRVDVICLESGAAGDRIRVTTRDRKRIYVAEVVAPNALKGTFPR